MPTELDPASPQPHTLAGGLCPPHTNPTQRTKALCLGEWSASHVPSGFWQHHDPGTPSLPGTTGTLPVTCVYGDFREVPAAEVSLTSTTAEWPLLIRTAGGLHGPWRRGCHQKRFLR